MKVTRREFMKYCTASAAALGLTSALGPLSKALASTSGPPIIWLKGASCTGCTVSLANLVSSSGPVDVADLLINTIDLAFHPTLMGAAGDQAVQTLRNAAAGTFILAVEGGIPTLYNGRTCTLWTENGTDVTALAAVKELAPKAAKVLSIGTCASFNGICGANPNPTGIKSVSAATGVSTINIPGCPTHPDWIVWTIAQLLAGTVPTLDSLGRPTALFGKTVHSQCSRRSKDWATSLSDTGLCMNNLGCKGQQTYADCPTRKWNNGTNWCVGTVTANGNGADSLCLGCTQSGFPDKFAPLFSTMGATQKGHKTIATNTTCTACHTDGKPH
ncbi:hydrogenase small subunit [Geobacter hydrogenophilus]|uniref:Iron hydrogenase n=1 Tax=Geobacter hydrogenophilus TaxID=40983 RepID=A0A9W6LBK6_9BACT|nr:hydrogenase small subunit [Geobacter hydrogenophilus]MBT0894993.1 hydrogenase small subunit [Geobacter hydrogenophilus]GLI37035.1 iron hydrogenase [Geobacter hydrogenophilus]